MLTPQSPTSNNVAIQRYEATKRNSSGQWNANLTKGVGFYTFFSTAVVDFSLSTNGKYMQKKTYEKQNAYLMEKEAKIYSLVENRSELDKLKGSSRWKRISPECDCYRGQKYALCFLADENGKNTGYYKVIKLKRNGVEPEIIKYYKRVGW